ncbi:MAG: AAA family ATPase [Cypionkella sp.]|nr:AAA family ATPase [Cypionkella sp.]
MRFTKLRLNGFKSFVDPTDLVIHDGLTGVVGPNGCGKSNLLEALRWVMGENRASAMRGAGMEDVIFNGAASRGARHFAEVSLVLDNSDRLAPAGFNDADTVEITRRITRDAGSAYKLNTKELRARDVQLLFADASTGSHSPALVRQGQISELINAKPKARRRILEEAAGISGLYARRHEAELKLQGAEGNLTRVDDVLENLAQQLSALTRQAKQAARYREIAEELRRNEGQLLFRRWREADLARTEAETLLRARTVEASQAEAAARSAGKAREAAEDLLPPLREEEAIAAAILQRLTLQQAQLIDQETHAREMIEALKTRITELTRDAEREANLNRDAGETIARLEWELAQLTRAHEGHEARLSDSSEGARAASAALSEIETRLSDATEDAARLAARHQSAQRLAQDARARVERAEAEAARAGEASKTAESALQAAKVAYGAATAAQAEAAALVAQAEAALIEAEAARARAQTTEAQARGAKSEASGEAAALRAEVAALAKLVDRDTGAGGQLLDAVQVAAGYELALGAALADDLRNPEIDAGGATGWARLPDLLDAPRLPAGVQPLSAYVTAPPVLARRLAQIGIVDAGQGADLQPLLAAGQRLVTRAGDLLRWDGLRIAGKDAPSAAAQRLIQRNRLAAARADLAAVEARLLTAAQAHEGAQTLLADMSRADQMAREVRRAADTRVADLARASARAEADASIAEGKLEAALLAQSRHLDEGRDARATLAEAAAALAELPDLNTARALVDEVKIAVEAARITMLARRSAHDELRREGEARVRRTQDAGREVAGWKQRLDNAARRMGELSARKSEAEGELKSASSAPAEIAAKRAELSAAIAEAGQRKAKASDALSAGEGALREAITAEREAERRAGEAREMRARAEARVDAAVETVTLALERIAEEAGATPGQLLDTLKIDPDKMHSAEHLDAEVQRLRRAREALGAVNLRAEEDAREITQEYDQLAQEKLDLEEAIKKLRAGIGSLNREGRERLLAAFDQVNANFATLFSHLFGGGEARLVLVESDDPLEAGLEIMCQPPGKKLSTLSLLSGGEQTLTALALIFGVFLANPAPICVLDEVDAPLDDANVTRFCDLLDEMTRRTETRFLIITHHAVTMSRMDRLFGVTMAEQGVSQLVSVDLKRAEALVA